MTEYLIALNDEWVPDRTVEKVREKGVTNRAEPVSTDGPYTETEEHLGGFAVVDVVDVVASAAAPYWAGRPTVALDSPQEVHRFPGRARMQLVDSEEK